MIITSPGLLSDQQTITAGGGATNSSNVLDQLAAKSGLGSDGKCWIDIEFAEVANCSIFTSLTIDIVCDSAAALTTTPLAIIRIYMASSADLRWVQGLGGKVLRCTVPYELALLRYCGLIYTLVGTGTVKFNAAISPSKPRTDDNIQISHTNVGVPS